MDTLNTLLAGEGDPTKDNHPIYSEKTIVKLRTIPATTRTLSHNSTSHTSDDTETYSDNFDLPERRPLHRAYSNDKTESCMEDYSEEEDDCKHERARRERIPVHGQRTILIANLADRTTHKDIAGVVRGGRLLDIFLRNDRSATVSFVEGAANFLAYVKRNDVYLHAKRVRSTH